MTALIVLFICAMSAATAEAAAVNSTTKSHQAIGQPHIMGGSPAEKPIPYQVSLRYQKTAGSLLPSSLEHYCGGAFVRNDIVLTAAHCLQEVMADYLRQGRLYAVAGTRLLYYDLRSTFISLVVLAQVHPTYNITPNANDVAVLRLKTPFKGYNVGTIALATYPTKPGVKCSISGWGTLRYGKQEPASKVLRTAEVPLVGHSECKRKFGQDAYIITVDMMCAGYDRGGIDTCQGDSGGPLVCHGELAGVVSWGIECGLPNRPGVYANVTYLNPWIQLAIKNLQNTRIPKPSSAQTLATDLHLISSLFIFGVISRWMCWQS